MSDVKRTPGPLLVRVDGSHDGSLLDPCRLFHPYLQSRPEGGGVHIARSVRREDAERLAGCYNALEGLTDEDVAALPDAETMRAWLAERAKCKMCDDFGYYRSQYGTHARCTHCCSAELP